jgi:DNA-binding CsgD family transcriptional regulator
MDIAAGTELLERERELDTLRAALARARGGSGSVLLVEAPAGTGKSALLARVRTEARQLGLRVLEARGAVLERDFAFGVVRQLFEHELKTLAAAEREAVLAGAAGLAAELLDDSAREPASEYGERGFGAVHALYWLTVNLADTGPMLISVDDAHLADSSSLRFLDYLARRLEGLAIVAVAAGRPADPEAHELWRQLAEDPVAEVVRLQPLSESAAAEIVRERLGPDADPEFCFACHRATGGNPLFLRELVAAAREAGMSPHRDAAAAVAELGPPAIGRFVLHRLGRLGPDATALTRALAVLGGEAELPLAAAAAGLEVSDCRGVADLLVQAEVLAPDQRLRFVHPVVGTAIYEDLLPGERSARHMTAARLLDAAGAPAERVAAHILESAPGAEARWIEILRRAARDALGRADPAAAAAYLRRAVAEGPDDELRGELLCELGRWELALQDYEQARGHLRAVLDDHAALPLRARAATWLGYAEILGGFTHAPQETLDVIMGTLRDVEAAAAGDTGGPGPSAQRLALELDATALVLSRLALSLRRQAPQRLSEFERRAASQPGAGALARVHRAAEGLLRGEPAAAIADEVQAALRQFVPGEEPWVLAIAIETLILTDCYPAAERWLELALQAGRALGLAPRMAGAHAQRALLDLCRGAVGEAELDASTALELAGPRQFALPRIVAMGIQAAVERSDLDSGQALVDAHANLFEGERLFQDELLTARGRLRIATGSVEQGLTDLLRAGELLAAHGSVRPADWRAEAAAALPAIGEHGLARRIARDGLEAARRFGAPRALGRALRAGGAVAGDSEGLELLEQAAALAVTSPARLEAAYARADLGAELVRRRRRREGREVLRLALEEALKCGATALAERVRADLASGGGRPARLELSGVDALTPAERRVCELAAGELTNREVAQTLFVTEKTVELHLTSAYRKLGIRSRFQLASVMPSAAGSA